MYKSKFIIHYDLEKKIKGEVWNYGWLDFHELRKITV